MKSCGKDKELSNLRYSNVNNLHEYIMQQKLPIDDFKWIENKPKFNENSRKN